ncbi:nucleoid-associated protein [Lelliottia sp. 489]|uniref:nucleoid-associated protein n=1 Tax=Lelliottia sp. 489 TaxID=3156448 RepID=UPI003D226542
MTNITIRHVIVHELIKESNKDFNHSKPYNLRDTELVKTNEIVKKLVDGVIDLYGSKGNSAHYGIFINEKTKQGPVPGLFHDYSLVKDSVSKDFISLTKQVMKEMYHAAMSQPWASGGYVVFTDYITSGFRYLLVTMIKKTNGVTISDKLEPEEMIHLELGNINQAAKINFRNYEEYQVADDLKKTELSYLSFISKTTGQSAAAYFIAALGCDKGIASAGATRKLPDEIRRFCRAAPALKAHADMLRNDVIKYLEKQFENKHSAKLSDIEAVATNHMSAMDESERTSLVEKLMKHLNSEEVRIPSEFVINKTSLDKIRNVIYKTPSLSFNFDKDLLGSTIDAKVYYNDESASLTFNNLPIEAVTKIRTALKELNNPCDGD